MPNASFVVADALSYKFQEDLDAVYAFASLLHLNNKDFTEVCRRVAASLKNGGIFFISLKERSEYSQEIKKDKYGERLFFYYHATLVKSLAGSRFACVYEDHQQIGDTKWFTIALRKIK